MDGWTNPQGVSVYNFLIITSDHKEFLFTLQDLSDVSHTAKLLFDKIEDILLRIGLKKFAKVISDNASAIAAVRQKINEKYPSILNIRCILHCVNLISQNILSKLILYYLNFYYKIEIALKNSKNLTLDMT